MLRNITEAPLKNQLRLSLTFTAVGPRASALAVRALGSVALIDNHDILLGKSVGNPLELVVFDHISGEDFPVINPWMVNIDAP